jgi:ABC-type amino acid transport substrate-binding protein
MAAISLSAVLLSCNPSTQPLVLGTSADHPPYEFRQLIDEEDTVVGLDIALAEAIAEELGRPLLIDDRDFEGLLDALAAGEVDFVIAAMTPYEERRTIASFSQVYYVATQSVLLRAEDQEAYPGMASLAGVRVGAQQDSVQEEIVLEKLPNSQVETRGRIPDLVQDLKDGRVDALVLETPVAQQYAETDQELKVADIDFGENEGGSAVAVPLGETDFLEQINGIIDRLQADGSMARFVAEAHILNDTSRE